MIITVHSLSKNLYVSVGGYTVNSGDHLAKILRKRITIVGSTLRARSLQVRSKVNLDALNLCNTIIIVGDISLMSFHDMSLYKYMYLNR